MRRRRGLVTITLFLRTVNSTKISPRYSPVCGEQNLKRVPKKLRRSGVPKLALPSRPRLPEDDCDSVFNFRRYGAIPGVTLWGVDGLPIRVESMP